MPIFKRRLTAQGDQTGALKAYRDALAIGEQLARADPGNAGWQRDLSVSYDRLGNVLVAQGDRTGALKAYRDALAIREQLARADPGNGWQVDVLKSNARLATQGDDPARRWELIVTRLRSLAAHNKLTADDAQWLPRAEEELAKLKPP